MITENDIQSIFKSKQILFKRSLKDWSFEIVDDLDGKWGFTNFETKVISISREDWPTETRNIVELINHEVAHALCGHGRHDLEWWDKLIDIGGRGVWIHDNGSVQQARITD